MLIIIAFGISGARENIALAGHPVTEGVIGIL
jgi:hypothetical protein